MLECLAAAMVVVLVVWHPACRLFDVLDLRLVRFYGRISYSLYLLHMLGISFAFRLLGSVDLYHSGLSAFELSVLTTLASVGLVTPVAYLSWRLIEAPFVAFGRRLGASSVMASAIGTNDNLARDI
jgi:peptidoglycan/LPS O-acetylase OafA/YrhL